MTDAASRASRRLSRARLAVAVFAAAALLSGCSGLGGLNNSAAIYKRYSDQMAMSGKFRMDVRPADAPYSKSDLVRNFELVAFEPEDQLKRFYSESGDQRRLSKWTGAIRYRFAGDGVRDIDRMAFRQIAEKLSRSSGLEIAALPDSASEDDANLSIFVVSPTARELMAQDMKSDRDWYDDSIFKDWIETLNPPCFALLNAGKGFGGKIVDGAIFVKAELENPLRRACFVEEFTQTLGLVFDHDSVRPSIFNDDQEFIALTDHDLDLVRILYDPRLHPGMTRKEAAPILRQVVSGL